MIKFFRKIRQNLLSEGKTGKYLKYAIGEIVLVVIGILIALSINDWNDGRKKTNLKANYIESLKRDLSADMMYFKTQIAEDSIDLAKMLSFSKRLSNSFTTMDTLIQIARYEFLPFTDVNNDLNMSTYNSLISTGNISVLDKNTSQSLLKFNNLQLNSNSMIDRNDELYFNSVVFYRNKYPFNSEMNGINGPFMDSFWASLDENTLKSDFNGVLTAKIAMLGNSILGRKELLLKTADMLNNLNAIKN
ncbi:DUF6090 family protein [Geojedonia litorea]|uniref:DUF6090 family protein n=1 Tax=Geojedonia litorea TaxID=1268269 RepID=A0ABV9N960_9FLAO